MSHRESNDTSSTSGVSYPAGSSTSATTVKGTKLSQFVDSNRKLQSSGGFNGNPVEVFADGSVWDTVNNVYLFPGRDYNPQDVNKR